MPVIKVWCLPASQTEDDLRRLHQTIVAAVVSVPELKLKDENDMTCLHHEKVPGTILDHDCFMRLSSDGTIGFFTISAEDKKGRKGVFWIHPEGLPDELIQRAKAIWDAKTILAAVCGQKEYYSLVS